MHIGPFRHLVTLRMEWLFHFACIYLEKETENAVASKMQGWKLREWVNGHLTAWLESAREARMDSQQSY